MANIKSSAKRDEKSKELRAKNRADKTELKTMMKKFDAAVAEGDKDAAVSAYKVAVKTTPQASFLLFISKSIQPPRREMQDLRRRACLFPPMGIYLSCYANCVLLKEGRS